MVTDSRIQQYCRVAEMLKQGKFDIQVPFSSQHDDIDQLGRALNELAHTLEAKFLQINRLAQVTQQVNAGFMLEEVLNHVFDTFRPLIPYHRIGFALLDEREGLVRARWARSDAPGIKLQRGYSASLEGSSLQHIIESGEARILNDLVAYLDANPRSESTRLMVDEGMRSSLTCPLIALGKPIGFMFFSSMEPNTYRCAHIELFLQIAGQLAVIVEKSRLYEQLVELNELKNRFLGMAAHDLRSPLAVIDGYVKLLTSGTMGELTTQQTTIVNELENVCQRMLILLNDLLDINTIESGRLEIRTESVSLSDYLQEVQKQQQALARTKSIELRLSLPSELPTICLDPVRIQQVLCNLISNAIKFSNAGTTVCIGAQTACQEIQISVTDEGPGIPQPEIVNLFRAFGKTSVRPTSGEPSTGLGLAIAKCIVEIHGGRIWVESEVGHGSTFTFSLPLSSTLR